VENQCLKMISEKIEAPLIFKELLEKISLALCKTVEQSVLNAGIRDVIMAGGVSSSKFIRQRMQEYFAGENISLVFGPPDLSTDNAVGIAILAADRHRSME
jgi:N6-L-threonylcarbamoyladenine synthase